MLARIVVAWLMFCAFFAGMAVVRITDSQRVEKVVSEYNAVAARLRERLMEFER
jgi:hypothetical protein